MPLIGHPSEAELALYAGSDLGWLTRQRVEMHLRSCGKCQQEVTEFSSRRAAFAHDAPEPRFDLTGPEWTRLAAEMKANIRLGLEAGSCVGPSPVSQRPSTRWIWIPVAAAASLLFAAGGGIWIGRLKPTTPSFTAAHAPGISSAQSMQEAQVVSEAQVVLEAKDSGIQVRDGNEIVGELRSRSRGAVVYSVNAQGGIGASYIDRDTGTVTVNNIYYGQ